MSSDRTNGRAPTGPSDDGLHLDDALRPGTQGSGRILWLDFLDENRVHDSRTRPVDRTLILRTDWNDPDAQRERERDGGD